MWLEQSDVLTEEEYKNKKAEIVQEIEHLQNKIIDLTENAKRRFELVENSLKFTQNCVERFEKGSDEDRQQIMRIIGGSDLTLKDGKLNFIPVKPYYFIYKKPLVGAQSSNWRAVWDSNPRPIA